MSKEIKSVVNSGNCVGCGLCVISPSKMKFDKDGFLRPIDPVDDEDVYLSCPGVVVRHHNIDAPYDCNWGPLLEVNTGWAADEPVRHASSSGGVITALLHHLLDSSNVDAVVQTKVSIENPLVNDVYIHSSREQVLSSAGSRYSPSSPLSIIHEIIGDGRRYAFVGKPCDVAALRSFLEQRPELKSQFPYLLSFICAGVPSQDGVNAVLSELNVSAEDVTSFQFRGNGWPGKTSVLLRDGSRKEMTYSESWGQILNKFLQRRCKLCADGIGEAADVVCGDAWHESENGYPAFDEADGRSLILTRTKVGRDLLRECEKDGVIAYSAYDKNNLSRIQPYQYNRKRSFLARSLAVWLTLGVAPVFRDYSLFRCSLQAGFSSFIKSFLATLLRRAKGRI